MFKGFAVADSFEIILVLRGAFDSSRDSAANCIENINSGYQFRKFFIASLHQGKENLLQNLSYKTKSL